MQKSVKTSPVQAEKNAPPAVKSNKDAPVKLFGNTNW